MQHFQSSPNLPGVLAVPTQEMKKGGIDQGVIQVVWEPWDGVVGVWEESE